MTLQTILTQGREEFGNEYCGVYASKEEIVNKLAQHQALILAAVREWVDKNKQVSEIDNLNWFADHVYVDDLLAALSMGDKKE